MHPCKSVLTRFRSVFFRRVPVWGDAADVWPHWLAAWTRRSPCWRTGRAGVKVEHKHTASAVIVCASDVGKRMSSSVSSSSCSTSDPHTHCPSTDLYTPNYPQQPHDSIHSSTPYVKTINTHTEGWHIQTRSAVSVFWSPGKSCCHCFTKQETKVLCVHDVKCRFHASSWRRWGVVQPQSAKPKTNLITL